MTQPQINSITPAVGLASGALRVVITGVHFREMESKTSGSYQPSVSVTFGGVAADAVAPVSRFKIVAVVPQYVGSPSALPATVDLVVTNLDDNGDPIPGESATLADAFTYRRPKLARATGDPAGTVVSVLDRVNRELLRTLRRNLIDEVVISSDPDWSRDPAGGLTAIAQLPAVLVDGPTVQRGPGVYRTSEREYVQQPDGTYEVNRAPFTATLTWSIVIVSESKEEVMNLQSAALRYFDRRPFLLVPVDAEASSFEETNIYMGDWSNEDQPANRLYAASTTLRLEPVYLRDNYGFASGGVPAGDIVSSSAASGATLEVTEHE